VVVIGVGNRALSDEGVGPCIACAVAPQVPPGVEVVDAGLPGPGILDLLEGRRKAIILDAVDAGCSPGKVLRFRPEEVTYAGHPRRYSLHEAAVLQYIMLAKALGGGPEKVVLIGVQPQNVLPGEKLSAPVEKAVAEAAELVLAELRL
jgi:hydrogenase maturation protease